MSNASSVAIPAAPSNGNAQEVIREAQQELNQLLRQRIALMRRIGTVKQALLYLANALGDQVLTPEVLELWAVAIRNSRGSRIHAASF